MNSKIEKVIICQPDEEDFDKVVELLEEITGSIKQKKGWTNYCPAVIKNKQKHVYLKILKGESKIFIAKVNNKIIGLINMQVVHNIRHGWARAHLEEVVVKEEFRNKGIGTKLLDAVKKYCKENGIRVIKLLCGNQLTESHRFYEKNGYLFTDRGYRLELR